MKTCFIWFMAFLLVFQGCRQAQTTSRIDLNIPWKFHTGDDIGWAAPAFDDSKWEKIDPSKVWEEQGYQGYDGFAWYRIRVVIPGSLISNAFIKDSVQFKLGKIDDCDQVFLNGELIGENGKAMPAGTQPSADFFKGRSQWFTDRCYRLAANDPRVHWDKDNVLSVRAYDQGGDGGMFSKPFEISMVDLSDHILFDFTQSGFKFTGDTVISKQFSLTNISSKEDFKGILVIRAIRNDNGNELFRQDTLIDMTPGLKLLLNVNINKDSRVPAVIRFTFREKSSGKEVNEDLDMPYILTPKPPKGPRINGARVFGVRPWSPFLYKIAATGETPLAYSAEGLPTGLQIHHDDGRITGILSKKGDYKVILKVSNQKGTAERELLIKCGDVISLTPPMGWNSWNVWGLSVSDRKVRLAANTFVASGLINHGWTYINIDDGWEDTHDKSGNIIPNSKFPDMKGLCSYVHSLGLKIGIYSSPGPRTCGGYEGSYTFEEKDARNYSDWGIDYLKYDWCSYDGIAPNPSLHQMKAPYLEMRKYLRKVSRDIHFSLCQYGRGDVWKWGHEVDGNSWRTTGDIEDTWESLTAIGFAQDKCSPYAAPGRWNDPDMLVVGWVGWGPTLHYTRLTPDEQYTHITLWSLLSAPLLIGCDLNQLDEFTLNLLTNDEVLAIDQDPGGSQAKLAWKGPDSQIWIKELQDGSRAIGLFNLTEKVLPVGVKMENSGLKGKWMMRDAWSQNELGMVETHFEMKVQPHGARLLVLKRK